MIDRLENYLSWLKTKGEFISLSEFKQKLNIAQNSPEEFIVDLALNS
jgi:hypothetical protein